MPRQTATMELASLEQTVAFGRHLGQIALAGDIITLAGALGTGKTTLTQAIGQGLEVPEQYYITSPSFSLLHDYPGRVPLYHLDLYRLSGEEDLAELGLEEYLYGEGLTVIEWPDRLGAMMPADRLHIELLFRSETSRTVRLAAHGLQWRERFAGLGSKRF